MEPEPCPPRFQYVWCARLTQVGASVVACMSTASSFFAVSVYVTFAVHVPGKPSSPAALT